MELSEEEKRILELIKQKIEKSNKYIIYVDYPDLLDLIKIIDKQQKGIEKYKNVIRNLNKNWISKEEIREKIKELEKLYGDTLEETMTSYEMFVFVRSYIDKVKNILKELLEENNEESDPL